MLDKLLNLINIFKYKRGYVIGVHTQCPKCKLSYYKGTEVSRFNGKKRTTIYIECKCGYKYKYYFGI